MSVYICPTRDIECGNNPAHWCHTCPQQHRPEPDCRTCVKRSALHIRTVCALPRKQPCTNGDRYEPLPPVRLWRKA